MDLHVASFFLWMEGKVCRFTRKWPRPDLGSLEAQDDIYLRMCKEKETLSTQGDCQDGGPVDGMFASGADKMDHVDREAEAQRLR